MVAAAVVAAMAVFDRTTFEAAEGGSEKATELTMTKTMPQRGTA
jgi:hypothetical protein